MLTRAITVFAAPVIAALVGATLLCGCEVQPAATPPVQYGSSPAIGAWKPESAAPTAGDPNGGNAGSVADPRAPAGTGTAISGSAGKNEPVAVEMPTAGSSAMNGNPTSDLPRSGGTGGAAGAGGTSGSGAMAGSVATSAGSGGTGMVAMPVGTVTALTFEVLTKTLNGRYSPKNIGAIWIEDASGKFVKTLKVWAATRARWLARWRAEAQSNKVDAVTSATIKTHMTHSVSWNLTDVNRMSVAAGNYKLVVEITDHDGNGDSTEVPFALGDPIMLTPSDQAHFVSMKLAVE